MHPVKLFVASILIFSLAACSNFVRRDEFDATVADLRSADDGLRAADNDLRTQLELMETRFTRLTQELEGSFNSMQAQITDLQGRLRVDMTAHFGFDDYALRDEDKAALVEFANVVRDFHPNVLVTVEGFTDPAGSVEYNKWLGQKRADSVRTYLIETGIDPDKVRAVSYGEDQNRQITPGASGTRGSANRRVALVIDYIAG